MQDAFKGVAQSNVNKEYTRVAWRAGIEFALTGSIHILNKHCVKKWSFVRKLIFTYLSNAASSLHDSETMVQGIIDQLNQEPETCTDPKMAQIQKIKSFADSPSGSQLREFLNNNKLSRPVSMHGAYLSLPKSSVFYDLRFLWCH